MGILGQICGIQTIIPHHLILIYRARINAKNRYAEKMNQRMDLTGVEIASVEMKSNEYPLFYKIDESGLIKNSGLIKIFKIELPGN